MPFPGEGHFSLRRNGSVSTAADAACPDDNPGFGKQVFLSPVSRPAPSTTSDLLPAADRRIAFGRGLVPPALGETVVSSPLTFPVTFRSPGSRCVSFFYHSESRGPLLQSEFSLGMTMGMGKEETRVSPARILPAPARSTSSIRRMECMGT